MPAVKQASLFYTNGSSDKEYHAQIVDRGDGYAVDFQYGRRGGPLQTGSKTPSPVALEKATAIFDKLVKEKTSKGYTPGESGVAYQGTDKGVSFTGILPQLLNPIDEREASAYLNSLDWIMQEKQNGERVLVKKLGNEIIGINKKGIVRPLPEPLVAACRALEEDFLMDGELLGSCYAAFDLLEHQGQDLRAMPYSKRYTHLLGCVKVIGGFVRVCSSYTTPEAKKAALDELRKAAREGVVFKLHSAPYTEGKPASGGDQIKLKFYETATVECLGANGDKRSVRMGLYDESGKLIEVGSVTIPPNADIPQAGAVFECRYLYAHHGGSLYQPSFLGPRSDQDKGDCLMTQLKFKPVDDLVLAA